MTSRPGTVLSGRYHLVESLGGGGMGSVWKAYDTRLERTVAVKELIASRDDDENVTVKRERVRHEAIALAQVEHPVIVAVHDLFYEGRGQDPWIVMAYVGGKSLDWIIRHAPPLDELEVARVGLAAAAGLAACHDRGVYHRDVKPANLIRGEDSTVRLVDFGIARIAGKSSLTQGQQVIGTLDYLSPEVLQARPAGPASDLWALGATLYCALDGQPPFAAESAGATMAAILSKRPPEPRTGGPLAALVLRMLAKDPASRPDAAALASALRRIAASRPPRHRPAAAEPLPAPRPGPAGPRPGSQYIRTPRRPTPLDGLPVLDAARIVSDPANDHAVADLLTVERGRAASIIRHCAAPAGGRLLSAIAAEQPALAWKLLDMVPADRAGQLLDHMSSLAAASALAVPAAKQALPVLGRADELTVVATLAELPAASAAALLLALDDEPRAARLLVQTANPVVVAGIARSLDAGPRQGLLGRLPADFRDLVATYLRRPAA